MKVHTVKSARKNYPSHGIKRGETYYWWKFRYGGRVMSKTYPKRSQLTNSSFLGSLYDLEDRIGNAANEVDDSSALEQFVADITSTLEDLKGDCENNLENMPEHLRDTSTSGEMLTTRIEGLEGAISEFEDIDCDYDEPSDEDLRSEAIEELQLDEDDEESLQDNEKEINEAIERLKEEKLTDWIQEKIDELSNISLDF